MSAPVVKILVGHVLDKLAEIGDGLIHCVITSPPYWGLRDFSRCECAIKPAPVTRAVNEEEAMQRYGRTDFRLSRETSNSGQVGEAWKSEPNPKCPKCHGTGKDASLEVVWDAKEGCEHGSTSAFCRLCGAWRGQLGLEPTLELYVQHIVQVFREVRRVLRDDGTLWLDLGDQYQDKQMTGMPWRVAFALQADGWYLRSDIIWEKPNPMPEGVADRPTKAHEYVFLMTKNARYFYDADAVREPHRPQSFERYESKDTLGLPKAWMQDGETPMTGGKRKIFNLSEGGRNLRSVWTIPTQAYPEAHFATFPEALAERCIKAGTSERGCCRECGMVWKRVVEVEYIKNREYNYDPKRPRTGFSISKNQVDDPRHQRLNTKNHPNLTKDPKTIGFRPPCDHAGEPTPCIVLDPFAGSGTVGAVARRLGRSSILIEIKEQYVEMLKKRVGFAHKPLDGFQ